MNATTPLKALNKAFRKVKPTQSAVDSFKQAMLKMKAGINAKESEAYHENLFRDFLMETYYRGHHAINKHERQDLAIHVGKKSSDKVGVIIEAKKPGSSEMATIENINTKAIRELLLYYLRERINHQNDEVKHLIITDLNHYFIFDAQVFDKAFARDKALVARFKDWQNKRLTSSNTDHFYDDIAAGAVAAKLNDLSYTYIDLSAYDAALRSTDNKGIRKIVALYKIFSPQHLLKQPFVNDSNTLDKAFYAELLHIIGLTEVTVSGKKLIQRKPPAERDSGSLLELTISKLASLGKLSRIPKVMQYGTTQDERLFAVGLELVIIWINRILFLKLLEAQLIAG